jgi:hypothetical protein
MSGGRELALSRRRAPELCENEALQDKGAGKTGRRLAPMAPVRVKCTGQEPQAQPRIPGLPCAAGLTVYSVLSLVTGLSCHHHLHDANASMQA